MSVTLPPWLLVAALLPAGPILFRLRLRRVRARRASPRLAEWLIADPTATDTGRVGMVFRLAGSSRAVPRCGAGIGRS